FAAPETYVQSVGLVGGAKAKTNLWVAARGGSAVGGFRATDGWAYVWAYTDVDGTVSATQTASVTAWGDLKAKVTSWADGVEAFASHDMTGDIQAATWADLEAQ